MGLDCQQLVDYKVESLPVRKSQVLRCGRTVMECIVSVNYITSIKVEDFSLVRQVRSFG